MLVSFHYHFYGNWRPKCRGYSALQSIKAQHVFVRHFVNIGPIYIPSKHKNDTEPSKGISYPVGDLCHRAYTSHGNPIPQQILQMAFCDLSHTFHKQVTNVSRHVFVILLWGILTSPRKRPCISGFDIWFRHGKNPTLLIPVFEINCTRHPARMIPPTGARFVHTLAMHPMCAHFFSLL